MNETKEGLHDQEHVQIVTALERCAETIARLMIQQGEVELAILHLGTIVAGRNAMKMSLGNYNLVTSSFAELLNRFKRRIREDSVPDVPSDESKIIQ